MSDGVVNDTGSAGRARGRLAPRRRLGLALHAAVVAALVPAYLLAAPASHWDPVAITALALLGVAAIRSEVVLPSGIAFEALSALALIAVAIAGPLPALAVTLAPIAVNALCGREALLRAGNLANLAAYGAYTLTLALVLAAMPPDAAPPVVLGWLLAAGLLQLLLNWAIGPAIYATLWLGHRPRTAVEMLRDGLPAGAAMTCLGAATVLLVEPLGVAALAVFAAIAVLPQSALTFAARTRPVARLDAATATRRYAHALALQLDLPRERRRHLTRVAALAAARRPTGDPMEYVRATTRHRGDEAVADAHLLPEWWNGRGRPLGLSHEAIPLAARVLAVAEAWSALTARGTAELGHHDALVRLQEQAGQQLDPHVVQAARAVIAQERVSALEPAPEPRLHRLRVPAAVRRALAATA